MGAPSDLTTGVGAPATGVSRSTIVIGAGEAIAAALRRGEFETITSFDGPIGQATAAVFVAADRPTPDLKFDSVANFRAGVGGDLKAAFLFLRRASGAMRAGGGGGSVIFVAPTSNQTAHDTARQGLRLLVKAAALELGPEGIRVNIVLPAEPATQADIADAVAFLASERAMFMTGADLVVDGGRAAR